MKDITQYYSPNEVSKIIELSPSSVRRYSIALEDAGYNEIKRNDKGHRRYTAHDVKTVQYLHTLVSDKKVPFNEAITKTLEDQSYIVNDVDIEVLDEVNETERELKIQSLEGKMDQLIEMTSELVSQNKALVTALDQVVDDNKRLLVELDKRTLTVDSEPTDATQTVEDNQLLIGNADEETPTSEPVNEDKTEDNENTAASFGSKLKRWFTRA